MKKKNKIITKWFKTLGNGLFLWGTIERGELTLSDESKLALIKHNNKRLVH